MKKTQVMGILNCTPDSFYDGGSYFQEKEALARGFQMIEEGADIIDIGGESTRPFAEKVSEEEELRRVLPIVGALSEHIKVSIDTCKPSVAKKAIEAGASFLNDVTGFQHPQMRQIAAETGAEICLMHMQGTPQQMQIAPYYPLGVIDELLIWFQKQIDLLLKAGILPEKIYIDPGIGFGKSVDDNLTILKNLSRFKTLGFPLLLGISRKSFMSKILQKTSRELLSTTVTINTISILAGVQIIRVHDVKEHRDAVKMIELIQ